MQHTVLTADLREKGTYETYRYAGRFGIPILYEDNHILAAVKPAGVLSQSDGSGRPDMLTILKEYLKTRYGKPGDVFLGLLHRLDCPVSGIMVFARTSKAASRISAQIRERTVDKRYFAEAEGLFGEPEGRLSGRIAKGAGNIVAADEDGKDASLSYRVLQADPPSGRTLLEVRLETGRAHQIRYLFSAAGHPLAGDSKYGTDRAGERGIRLFACRFTFRHPVRDEEITLRVFPDRGLFGDGFLDYFDKERNAGVQNPV